MPLSPFHYKCTIFSFIINFRYRYVVRRSMITQEIIIRCGTTKWLITYDWLNENYFSHTMKSFSFFVVWITSSNEISQMWSVFGLDNVTKLHKPKKLPSYYVCKTQTLCFLQLRLLFILLKLLNYYHCYHCYFFFEACIYRKTGNKWFIIQIT